MVMGIWVLLRWMVTRSALKSAYWIALVTQLAFFGHSFYLVFHLPLHPCRFCVAVGLALLSAALLPCKGGWAAAGEGRQSACGLRGEGQREGGERERRGR